MTENLDVLFRADRKKEPEITAVFPTLPWANDYDMTCYAHVGQHGGCSTGWYHGTRRAKPAEYADLLAELKRIYAPEFTLTVKQKITPQHRAKRQAAAQEWRENK